MDPEEETNTNMTTTTSGRVLNVKRRAEIAAAIKAEEAEYEKLLLRRPEMGQGIVGGRELPAEYAPSDHDIMQTMQTCDMEWDEAKCVLIFQHQESQVTNVPQHEHTPHLVAVRKQRIKSISQTAKERAKQRELQEQRERQQAEEALTRKKEIARSKGLQLEQRKLEETERQIQASHMHKVERTKQRLKVFDVKTGSPGLSTHTPADSRPADRLYSTDGRYNLPHTSNLPQQNSPTNSSHRTVTTNQDHSSPQLSPTLTKKSLPSSPPHHRQTTSVHTVTSWEWQALLECSPALRDRVIQAMAQEVSLAEAGECLYPSLEFMITCERDRVKGSSFCGGGQERRRCTGFSAAGIVNSVGAEHIKGMAWGEETADGMLRQKYHLEDDDDGERYCEMEKEKGDEVEESQSLLLTKEEMRRQRVKHYMSASCGSEDST